MLKGLSERIDQRLRARRLSAGEAGRLAGLSKDTIRNIKRAAEESASGASGRVGVSTRTLTALAEVLGTTPGWLMEGGPEVGGAAGGEAAVGGGGLLPFVEWAEASIYSAPDRPTPGDRTLEDRRWPPGTFVTRVPDNSMNRLSPAGSYIVVERGERAPIEGLCYLGVLEGVVHYRRWFGQPERIEPFSTEPVFKIDYLSAARRWEIVGRVRRTFLDI